MLRKVASTPQKHPAPKVAFSIFLSAKIYALHTDRRQSLTFAEVYIKSASGPRHRRTPALALLDMGLLAATAVKAAPKRKILEPDRNRLDDHDLALTFELQIDQGLVGTAQHLPRLLAGRIEREHAAEAGQGVTAPLEAEMRFLGALAHLFQRTHGVFAVGVGQQHGELVLVVVRHHVVTAEATQDFVGVELP